LLLLLFLTSNSLFDGVFVIPCRALQESADRLKSSFEALGPQGGYLSTAAARDVLVRTGLEKDQLRLIWNLSDIDRDGLFDHDEYVVAMFLCDAVIQKGRPIPAELPATVIPPRKRELIAQRKKAGF
jgi:EH domain-containing protein 1